MGSEREHVILAGPTDIEGFRREARRLVRAGRCPGEVDWSTDDGWRPDGQLALHDDAGVSSLPAVMEPPAPPLQVPPAFVALCRQFLLHREPSRFALAYRLLWRLLHEPTLRHDPLDGDMMRAQKMAQAVRRDIHKMRAFVRFTDVGGRRVAWFEPGHHIVAANAPFFTRRFAQMHWSILTPELCVDWDGQHLTLRPGASVQDKPAADAGEHLWLAYYQSTFNPARPKFQMMVREMPRRYWPHLPEAALIAPLAAAAAARSAAMLQAPPTLPRRMQLLAPTRPVTTADESPQSIEALRAATNACRQCPLGAQATQAVCGEGTVGALHMLVGEQPGDREDLAGRPFVGPAGALLDRAMEQLGWPREAVYLANAVKHFKYELRGKRRIHKTPAQREVQACTQWLEHEIALTRPHWLVALGATAARALLGRDVAVQAERGHWQHGRIDGRPVFVTLHPAALLRMPAQGREAAYENWVHDLGTAQRGV